MLDTRTHSSWCVLILVLALAAPVTGASGEKDDEEDGQFRIQAIGATGEVGPSGCDDYTTCWFPTAGMEYQRFSFQTALHNGTDLNTPGHCGGVSVSTSGAESPSRRYSRAFVAPACATFNGTQIILTHPYSADVHVVVDVAPQSFGACEDGAQRLSGPVKVRGHVNGDHAVNAWGTITGYVTC